MAVTPTAAGGPPLAAALAAVLMANQQHYRGHHDDQRQNHDYCAASAIALWRVDAGFSHAGFLDKKEVYLRQERSFAPGNISRPTSSHAYFTDDSRLRLLYVAHLTKKHRIFTFSHLPCLDEGATIKWR
jgi:hypothetical protein